MKEVATIDASVWDQGAAVRASAQGVLRKDVLEPAVRRVGLMAGSAAGLLSIHLAVSFVLVGPAREIVGPLGVGLGCSLLVLLLTKVRPKMGGRAITALSVSYLFALCLSLGALHPEAPLKPLEALTRVSLSAVPILAFAALVPVLPRRAFVIALVAGLMDPLALALTQREAAIESIFVSVLFAAFVAWIAREISAAVHRLSEDIKRARRVGSYRLVEPLGVGGMAEVWRAEHTMLARPAAIKLIRPVVLTEHGPLEAERLLRLFTREARTTARLSSPHTIILYDFGINREGGFYQVMELLDGLDLQTLVERFGPQPSSRVTHLLRQACHSLREAHDAHFVHRDVKPANIFACALGGEFDFVKVLDFGLVLDRQPTSEEIEDEQRLVGTPAIMAPEMLRYQVPVDARADIYALGCVGYWLLTGTRVFEANTKADMLVMHAHQKPVTPSKRLGIPVHPGLEATIMSCLEKNPNKRPQTAAELMDRLSALTFEDAWNAERRALWWRRNVGVHPRVGSLPGEIEAAVGSMHMERDSDSRSLELLPQEKPNP
jgi:hypothetical protein